MVNNKLNEINMKNCTCYYLNDFININDLDFEKYNIRSKII